MSQSREHPLVDVVRARLAPWLYELVWPVFHDDHPAFYLTVPPLTGVVVTDATVRYSNGRPAVKGDMMQCEVCGSSDFVPHVTAEVRH